MLAYKLIKKERSKNYKKNINVIKINNLLTLKKKKQQMLNSFVIFFLLFIERRKVTRSSVCLEN